MRWDVENDEENDEENEEEKNLIENLIYGNHEFRLFELVQLCCFRSENTRGGYAAGMRRTAWTA